MDLDRNHSNSADELGGGKHREMTTLSAWACICLECDTEWQILMNTRLLSAGLAAGMAMFVWGAISHMALPLGEIGIQSLPDEAAVAAVLKDKVKDAGLYLYPGEKDMSKFEQVVKDRPRGLLTITPAGTPFSMGSSLGVQCVNDIFIGLLLAWLLSKAAASLAGLGAKLCFASVLAIFATLAYLGPFWNWYGFSAAFVVAGAVDAVVACVIGTLVIVKIMRW